MLFVCVCDPSAVTFAGRTWPMYSACTGACTGDRYMGRGRHVSNHLWSCIQATMYSVVQPLVNMSARFRDGIAMSYTVFWLSKFASRCADMVVSAAGI